MKIEINNQTTATIGQVLAILAIEYIMSVFKLNYIISLSVDIALCIFFNIFNYMRFRHFQTKKELQLSNNRLGAALLVMNLAFIIGIVAILMKSY